MRIYFLVITLFGFSLTAFTQKGPVYTSTDKIDFGTIYMNQDSGIRELSFTNTGNEPLILTDVKSSCGCLVPEWPKEPIMPGQSNIIKARYDIKRIGPINKTINITTNEIEEVDCLNNITYKNHIIRVLGNVLTPPGPWISSYQYNKINFGDVYADEDSGIRLYEVENMGTENLILSSPISSNPNLTASVPDKPIKPGESGYIKIIYDMNIAGELDALITIETNQPTYNFPQFFSTYEIKVYGNILKK